METEGQHMKYIDLIAYPIMLFVVYIFIGIVSWDSNPANWPLDYRFLWIVWGLVWGFGLQRRIARGGDPWTLI
jgi:hypothetical protein